MRIAWDEKILRQGFGIAQAEASAAFSNSAVYLRKYLVQPRHIEIQLFGDGKGASSTWASASARCSATTRS